MCGTMDSMVLPIFLFAVSFVLLLWSGKILPRTLQRISKILHISEFLTAFLLIAFATSVPELFVGISSAIQGVPSISLGNVLGANFINLTLVIGLAALFSGFVSSKSKISSENFWLASAITFLPILLSTDGVISRGDAVLLLGAFVLYLMKIFQDKEYFHKASHTGEPHNFHSISNVFKNLVHFAGATALLVVSSFVLVWSSKIIIGEYFASDFLLFGLIFIALGTTLPELVFGVRSSMSGHSSAMLGNAVGTIAFNAAGVVGIVALVQPITMDFSKDILLVGIFLGLALFFFHFFVYTKGHINRLEALVLLLVYLSFIGFTFLLS